MIKPEDRLWAGSGNLLTGGPYTWHVTDFDQRRHFSVTRAPPAPVENVEATEEICLEALRKHVDELGDDVYGIRFSEPGGPITKSTSPDDDVTLYVNNYPLSALKVSHTIKTIFLENLTELDRLTPNVDLVSYREAPCVGKAGTETTAAFKYWFMINGMFRTWYELNSWSRLPRDHPHIVPFDAVVLDNVTGGIVGFTTKFIPGGTVQDTNATSRPFRLEWLQQLISVIDDLNYTYGIMHQDVAARNLVIDELGNLRIFDFNYAIMIDKHYTPDRDDTKGVIFTLYEIITLDEHFREVPHEEQDAEALLVMEWTRHPDVQLDCEVDALRAVLDVWVAERKKKTFQRVDTWIEWPWMPEPPLGPVLIKDSNGDAAGKEMKAVPVLVRRHLVSLGEPFCNWERPASHAVREGVAAADAVTPGSSHEEER